jgi:hypothetical protein
MEFTRDPKVKMEFNVSQSTKLQEVRDNILGQLAAGAMQVFLCS